MKLTDSNGVANFVDDNGFTFFIDDSGNWIGDNPNVLLPQASM